MAAHASGNLIQSKRALRNRLVQKISRRCKSEVQLCVFVSILDDSSCSVFKRPEESLKELSLCRWNYQEGRESTNREDQTREGGGLVVPLVWWIRKGLRGQGFEEPFRIPYSREPSEIPNTILSTALLRGDFAATAACSQGRRQQWRVFRRWGWFGRLSKSSVRFFGSRCFTSS